MAKKEAMDECVEELVKAIILQAVEDYRNALMVLNWYQGQKQEARRKADGDRIGRITAEIADTERQITAAKEEAERIRLEVRETVSQIREPMCQRTIMLHYLECQTLQEIATNHRGKDHLAGILHGDPLRNSV